MKLKFLLVYSLFFMSVSCSTSYKEIETHKISIPSIKEPISFVIKIKKEDGKLYLDKENFDKLTMYVKSVNKFILKQRALRESELYKTCSFVEE